MAGRDPQELQAARQNCTRCQGYAPAEKWEAGHYYCSSHRDCTGKKGWTPDLCEVCTEFKERFDTFSGGEQHSGMNSLKNMLRRTYKSRHKKTSPWLYLDVLKQRFPQYFLEGHLSSPTDAGSINQGHLPSPAVSIQGVPATTSQFQPMDSTTYTVADMTTGTGYAQTSNIPPILTTQPTRSVSPSRNIWELLGRSVGSYV